MVLDFASLPVLCINGVEWKTPSPSPVSHLNWSSCSQGTGNGHRQRPSARFLSGATPGASSGRNKTMTRSFLICCDLRRLVRDSHIQHGKSEICQSQPRNYTWVGRAGKKKESKQEALLTWLTLRNASHVANRKENGTWQSERPLPPHEHGLEEPLLLTNWCQASKRRVHPTLSLALWL